MNVFRSEATVPHIQSGASSAYLSPVRARYHLFKLGCDVVFSIAAIPILITSAGVLFCVNLFANPGPLLFSQERMGKHGRRFRMWKFRTMEPSRETVRAHDAPVEHHRISPFGRFLRKSRIDELPNFINVLRGEMSVVGPRPDAWDHAVIHVETIPNYRHRFRVRPGITGLAQVRGGYADSESKIRRKVRLDLIYTSRASISLESYIIRRTVRVMLTGFGAK